MKIFCHLLISLLPRRAVRALFTVASQELRYRSALERQALPAYELEFRGYADALNEVS